MASSSSSSSNTTASSSSSSSCSLKCGLIGFTDSSLISCGRFYPSSCKNGKEKLKHYASKFPIIEIDTSHYAIPAVRVIQDWIDATKQYTGFKFHIKTFGMFTLKQMSYGNLPFHVKQSLQNNLSSSTFFTRTTTVTWDMLGTIAQDLLWNEFNEKILKLHHADLLGVVLFQFQLDFKPTDENRRWVEYCRSRIPKDIKMVVEFRSRTWFDENNITIKPKTIKWLGEINCINVISDELLHELHRNRLQNNKNNAIPKSNKLASINIKVTDNSNLIYLRVHRREGKERLLNNDWMLSWKKRIHEEFLTSNKNCVVHVVMGTAWEDQAVKNCHALYKIMDINIEQVWRKIHRQSSVLSKLFMKQHKKNKQNTSMNNSSSSPSSSLSIRSSSLGSSSRSTIQQQHHRLINNSNSSSINAKRRFVSTLNGSSNNNNIRNKKKKTKKNGGGKTTSNLDSKQRLLSSFFK